MNVSIEGKILSYADVETDLLGCEEDSKYLFLLQL